MVLWSLCSGFPAQVPSLAKRCISSVAVVVAVASPNMAARCFLSEFQPLLTTSARKNLCRERSPEGLARCEMSDVRDNSLAVVILKKNCTKYHRLANTTSIVSLRIEEQITLV